MTEYTKVATLTTTLVLISSIYYSVYLSKQKSHVIKTKLGLIQGTQSYSRQGRQFYEFLGIPYAQSPVGNLRFEPPVPVSGWDGVKYFSQYGPECPQLEPFTNFYKGHEDCLHLNIFVPKVSTKKLLPVMVWIHGGSHATASSNEFKPDYLMDEDVILVTINFRLAALGFLSTGDEIVRGNMGLKDQTLALKWVQENIQSFDGDPNSVTIFGESSGSCSVSLHILSPMSKGLFSKAILQSGVVTSTWGIERNPAQRSRRLAERLRCPTFSNKEMVACLKKSDAKTLVLNHQEVYEIPVEPAKLFLPTVETIKDDVSFITDDPLEILKSRNFQPVPIIGGVNSHEGLIWTAIFGANQTKLDEANNEFYKWTEKYLNYPKEEKLISDKVRRFYFGDVISIASPEYIDNYTNLMSDRHFNIPLHNFVKNYSPNIPIYLYYFTYKGSFRVADIYTATQQPFFPVIINIFLDIVNRWIKTNILQITLEHPGVCHAEEMYYFFDWPASILIKKPIASDLTFSTDVVRLWVSFASDDRQLSFRNTVWTRVNPSDSVFQYLEIGEKPSIIGEPFTERVKFWETLGV